MIAGDGGQAIAREETETMQANATRPPSCGRSEIIELARRCSNPVAQYQLYDLADWVDVVASGCSRIERVPLKWREFVRKLACER